jgi:hypothetical protein
MSLWDMLGIISYTLAFALLETLLFLAVLLAAAFILPGKLYRERFVAQSFMIVILATAWALMMQFFGQALGLWDYKGLVGLLPFIAAMALAAYVTAKADGLRLGLESLADRLLLLGVLYGAIDIVFIAIMVVRNI